MNKLITIDVDTSIVKGMNKITEVTVKGLFGHKGNDYTVELLPDEPVTFIYGFNGIGKTTFLRLLNAAMNYDFSVLNAILFESIIVKFNTDGVLTVRRPIVKDFEEITVSDMRKFSKNEKGFYFPIVYESNCKYEEAKKFYFYFEPKWNDWLNSNETDSETKMTAGPAKFSDFHKHCPVSLRSFPSDVVCQTALIFANKDYNREFDEVTWNRDVRLFSNQKIFDTICYRQDEIKEIFAKENQPHESFMDVGYFYIPLPDKIDGLVKYLKSTANQDWTKYGDSEIYDERIDAYIRPIDNENFKSDFERRCEVFTEVINKKSGLTDKFINISTSGEITVTVRYGKKEFSLDIKKLSSGEKNLLLLYAHIIFAGCPCSDDEFTLFLLDEPEVSMHPDWLMGFVDNLQYINEKLGRGKKFQFVIATHSLAITYDHNEMMSQMKCINE